METKHFDAFIMLMITLSGITLALENPLNDPCGPLAITLKRFDYIVTGIFTVEFMLKAIAAGFLFNGP